MTNTLCGASIRRRSSSVAFYHRLILAGALALLFAGGVGQVLAQSLSVDNYTTGTVGKYDVGNGSTTSSSFISGLTNPIGMAVSGNTLYVANSGGGSVNAYDTVTGTVVTGFRTISPGSNPFDVQAAGGLLYVSSRAGNTVGAYNAATGLAATSFTAITDLSSPTGLAVANGILYVANRDTRTIRTYDALTGSILNPNFLSGVNTQFLTASGNTLYLSQSSGVNTVTAYDISTGTALAGFTTITGVSTPQGLNVVGNNLYVASFGGNAVFDPLSWALDGNLQLQLPTLGGMDGLGFQV